MAKKNDEKALEKVGSQSIVTYDYGEDEGSGFENVNKDDISVPFIVLLQALSPIVVEGKEGAVAGAWYNTITEQIYPKDKGFLFVPALKQHFFVEWVPRDKGGGFRGHHEVDNGTVREAIRQSSKFGKYKTPDGNDLVETFYIYGAVCDEYGAAESMGVIAFTSTKIRAYKSWISRMLQMNVANGDGRKIRPPMHAHLSRVLSKQMKNDKGVFFIPAITSANPQGMAQSLLYPDDDRFQMAKSCKKFLEAGDLKIDPEQQHAQSAGDEEEGPQPF